MGMTVVGYTSAYLAHLEFKRMLEEGIEDEPAIDKCPSCGSREFRQHAGRSVCSYCRSGP